MKIKRALLCIAGFLALAVGAIGIVLPILPTTPLVLLAAVCFSASSPKVNDWLKKSKHFGCYIDNYQNGTGVPREVKLHSIQFLWCTLAISAFFSRRLWVALLLLVVGIAVTLHIHSLGTKESGPP